MVIGELEGEKVALERALKEAQGQLSKAQEAATENEKKASVIYTSMSTLFRPPHEPGLTNRLTLARSGTGWTSKCLHVS